MTLAHLERALRSSSRARARRPSLTPPLFRDCSPRSSRPRHAYVHPTDSTVDELPRSDLRVLNPASQTRSITLRYLPWARRASTRIIDAGYVARSRRARRVVVRLAGSFFFFPKLTLTLVRPLPLFVVALSAVANGRAPAEDQPRRPDTTRSRSPSPAAARHRRRRRGRDQTAPGVLFRDDSARRRRGRTGRGTRWR